eukprot:CAMPEP_0196752954 /NCGR_PEP_ID=MMETSP1091-20130531/88939_1 /TAXON_ID=302021 /ORGANISM="Rhodomonas sp., Strain CCMP768" /LENGTH=179 /DNA_ID=CAMNT_0042100979 /DNA_START=73 /DNA_END=612 /DNA_ORIENTATION=-
MSAAVAVAPLGPPATTGPRDIKLQYEKKATAKKEKEWWEYDNAGLGTYTLAKTSASSARRSSAEGAAKMTGRRSSTETAPKASSQRSSNDGAAKSAARRSSTETGQKTEKAKPKQSRPRSAEGNAPAGPKAAEKMTNRRGSMPDNLKQQMGAMLGSIKAQLGYAEARDSAGFEPLLDKH